MGRPKKVVAASTLVTKIAPPGMLIPSGVTLLDLACTDTLDGFCTAGHGVNIIGDRDVGKTALALASQAETCRRHGEKFSYDFYDAENAFSFDVPRLWGKKFASALNVIPIRQEPEWSIEGIAHKIVESLADGTRRHIVIDSMDGLRARSEYDATEDILNGKGGYNTARAKANRYFFRVVLPRIAETGSFLIYLSQATVNIGFSAMFNPKTRGGGTALGYNAHVELWLSQGQSIKTDDVKVGHWVVAKTARSKANGKKRTLEFPILPAYGVDDTRANVEWLAEETVIPRSKGVYDLRTIGVEYEGKQPFLFVEENGFTDKVVAAVKDRWEKNERTYVEKTLEGRKPRYE